MWFQNSILGIKGSLGHLDWQNSIKIGPQVSMSDRTDRSDSFNTSVFPSCVSGRGFKIGPISLCVRMCVCQLVTVWPRVMKFGAAMDLCNSIFSLSWQKRSYDVTTWPYVTQHHMCLLTRRAQRERRGQHGRSVNAQAFFLVQPVKVEVIIVQNSL